MIPISIQIFPREKPKRVPVNNAVSKVFARLLSRLVYCVLRGPLLMKSTKWDESGSDGRGSNEIRTPCAIAVGDVVIDTVNLSVHWCAPELTILTPCTLTVCEIIVLGTSQVGVIRSQQLLLPSLTQPTFFRAP